MRDANLAEELAQNVFATLAQKAGSVRPPHVTAGWLYNTSRNLAMHTVRSEQRRLDPPLAPPSRTQIQPIQSS
jgi:DNA-directed RNA polymerase specialized sigma24 family protein